MPQKPHKGLGAPAVLLAHAARVSPRPQNCDTLKLFHSFGVKGQCPLWGFGGNAPKALPPRKQVKKTMTDDEIIKMLFERAEDAIEEMRKKYEQGLLKISMNFLNNRQDAEECVNDTFLRAWNTIPPHRPMLNAYLYKIVRNISLNKLKAKNTQKRGGDATVILEELENCIPNQLTSNTPEEIYESGLTTIAINEFLATLKKHERMTFVLRYFYGESIQDICQRFDFSESKVKSLLYRLRKRLQAYLEKEGVAL